MQRLLAVIRPLKTKRDEPPHAVLAEQLTVMRDHFALGKHTGDIAATRNIAVQAIDKALWDAMETLTWLFTHERYLNFGKEPLTSKDERALLTRTYVERMPPTPAEKATVSAIAIRVFGLSEQVLQ